MFQGDSADMCAGKFPLKSIGGRVEGLACPDPGERTAHPLWPLQVRPVAHDGPYELEKLLVILFYETRGNWVGLPSIAFTQLLGLKALVSHLVPSYT